MNETFKMIKIHPKDVAPVWELHTGTTRGHTFKLSKIRSRKSTRQHFFSLRVTNLWNSLPKNVLKWTQLSTSKNCSSITSGRMLNLSSITELSLLTAYSLLDLFPNQDLDIEDYPDLRPEEIFK